MEGPGGIQGGIDHTRPMRDAGECGGLQKPEQLSYPEDEEAV